MILFKDEGLAHQPADVGRQRNVLVVIALADAAAIVDKDQMLGLPTPNAWQAVQA